jgi:DNA polymerase (family 10)
MTAAEMTSRLLAAMDNPYLTIIGHPTGRLLLSRDPYGLDLDLVVEKAAERKVALEINADPHRLDLDWRVLKQVREGGVMVSIGADAHSVAGIDHVQYGIGMARKGWLGATDILNSRSAEEFTAWAGRRRS